MLASNGIAISMDGKGAWRDNVFVERLWRSVKYEEVYLHAYDSALMKRWKEKRVAIDPVRALRARLSFGLLKPEGSYMSF